MAEFFAELKRRHIYRVGAAYVVIAWALTQVVDVLSQVFELAPWIAQSAIVLLAIGFPLALIAAWVIESKPHQAVAAAVRSKPTLLDLGLFGAVALLVMLTGYQQITASAGTAQQPGVIAAREAAASPRTGVSIAVLPFTNLSSDPEQEFFSDGMTEEITAALAKVPDLRVVGRTSAFEFKGQNRDLRAIGQSLSATHLIEGSVRKAGERMRITAQLINARDGTHIWAESYDRQLTDVFVIQQEIATAVAGALRMPLGLSPGQELVSSRAIDPASYEQFLRGRAALGRARTAFADQLQMLEPVVTKNPEYAPAWAALARAYRSAAQAARYLSREEYQRARASYEPKMIAAAQRAAELDPNSPDVLVTLATTQSGPRRLLIAEDLFAKALALDPNHGDALSFYSGLLLAAGRVKEAVTIKQRLSQIEPYVPLYIGNLGEALWLDGQVDAAISIFNQNFGREGVGAALALPRIYASLGRYKEAADTLSRLLVEFPRMSQTTRDMVSTAERLLRSAPAKAAEPESVPRLSDLSFVFLHVGAPERALEPYEEGRSNYPDTALLGHSSYAVVRKTERFKRIIREAGLVEYWRAKGWPEFCRPTTGDDFVCD